MLDSILSKKADFLETVEKLGISLVACIAILVIGFFIIKLIEPYIRKIINKLIKDETVERFVANLTSYILKLIVILIAVTKVGVETASLVALLGAAGFAIGLAFQGALSNFAGGILILTQRPFSVDDYIDVVGVSGIVHSISILSTILYTPDNKVITIPNGKVANDHITNYSKLDTRRVDLKVTASYSENSEKVIGIIKKVVESNDKVLQLPQSEVVLSGLKDSAVEYTIRAWVNTADYWNVYFYLLENIKISFDKENIEIPYNKLDVNVIK